MAKVKVYSNNGTLNLRFRWQGKDRKLSLGVGDDRKSRAWAEIKAKELEFAQTQRDFDLDQWKKSLRPDLDPPKPETVTLAEIWAAYAEHRLSSGAIQLSNYNRNYRSVAYKISQLKHDDLERAVEIRNELLSKYSPESARRQLEQFNAACRWACEQELIEVNPFADLKIQTKRRSARPRVYYSQESYTAAERDAIVEAFYTDRFANRAGNTKPSYYADAVAWGFNSGVRPEELWALRIEHCRDGNLVVCQAMPTGAKLKEPKPTKTETVRQLPLNAELQEILARRQQQFGKRGLLFPAPRGGYVNYWNFRRRLWKQTIDGLVAAGDISRYLPPKCMRHTFTTLSLYNGLAVHQVANWIGDDVETLLKHYASILGRAELPTRTGYAPRQ